MHCHSSISWKNIVVILEGKCSEVPVPRGCRVAGVRRRCQAAQEAASEAFGAAGQAVPKKGVAERAAVATAAGESTYAAYSTGSHSFCGSRRRRDAHALQPDSKEHLLTRFRVGTGSVQNAQGLLGLSDAYDCRVSGLL